MVAHATRHKSPASWLLLCLLAMVLNLRLSGQEADFRVTIHGEKMALREMMDQIEKQTGLSFSYSSRLIDEEYPMTLDLEAVVLEEALRIMFAAWPIRFERVERQIVLKRDRSRSLEPESPRDTASADALPVRFTVSGYVRDALSGEILIGATIAVPGIPQGSISNAYGFYSLTLEGDVQELICSFVGYRRTTLSLKGRMDQVLHFGLEKELTQINEVSVYSTDHEGIIRHTRASEERLRTESVRKMPALFGEKDVIKSLASVPGIKFFGDGSTIFFVRGGGRDQNLITIDEAPVYNPTHLLGYFSTVIPDAVKDVKIYKGDFPAKYGGRLSSLIDIRTKDGNMKQFGMDGSLGLLSARLSLEGPLWKDHISVFASGRRSYISRFLQNWNPNIRDLHFSDFHFKLNYQINTRNRVFFSVYRGEDNFELMQRGGSSTGINWTNSTTSLRWNHLYSDQLFSNLTLLGSRYDYKLLMDIQANDYWNSRIENLSLKYDFTYYLKPSYTLRFGLLLSGHFHDPGNYYRGGVEWDPGYDLSLKYTREYALYFSNQYIIGPELSLRMGLRLTAWQNMGPATEYYLIPVTQQNMDIDSLAVRTYPKGEVYHQRFAVDPRVSLVWHPGPQDVITTSYNRTSQFQYLVTNSISPFTSLEVWLPAGPNVPDQSAHQFTLGYTRMMEQRGLSFSAELYYKRMNDLIDYRDHAHMLMNPLVEEELLFGHGQAYGLETILKKEEGSLKAWISYTYSRALYLVEEINDGKPYPAYSDRPHDLSLYLSWSMKPRLSLTCNFTYMTGAPFSTPTAFYTYDNHQVPVYGERNNDRLPDYHRLDVALNWQLSRPELRFQHELIFSVYNLYNRHNPVALHFNKSLDEHGNFVVPVNFYQDPKLLASQYYLYGLVPSLSYHFKF